MKTMLVWSKSSWHPYVYERTQCLKCGKILEEQDIADKTTKEINELYLEGNITNKQWEFALRLERERQKIRKQTPVNFRGIE